MSPSTTVWLTDRFSIVLDNGGLRYRRIKHVRLWIHKNTYKQDEFIAGLTLDIRFVGNKKNIEKPTSFILYICAVKSCTAFHRQTAMAEMHFAVYLRSRIPKLEYLAIQQKHNQSLVYPICSDSYTKQFKINFLERSINSAFLNISHVRRIRFCPLVLHYSYCGFIQQLQLELEFTEIN